VVHGIVAVAVAVEDMLDSVDPSVRNTEAGQAGQAGQADMLQIADQPNRKPGLRVAVDAVAEGTVCSGQILLDRSMSVGVN
jgi:hypothetical protein